MIFYKRWYRALKLEFIRAHNYGREHSKFTNVANERLEECSKCAFRLNDRCRADGSKLKVLAVGRATDCPKRYWKR